MVDAAIILWLHHHNLLFAIQIVESGEFVVKTR